jgi:peptidoglycan LD-endopeptidase LytH
MKKLPTYTLVAILGISLVIPSVSFARHNDDEGRGYDDIDRDDLDDDIVKKIPIPILFGLEYEDIRSDFGDPRDGGARQHEGQDMFAPEGTPLVSPTDAIVLSVGSGGNAGNFVYTANPGGESFRYMHLKDLPNLERGDELKAGDYIGTVGDTGNAKGTPFHLHFEMRDDKNEAQDPYPRLKGEFTLKQKMSFLSDIFKGVKNDDDYAEFLVENFTTEFKEAVREGYKLPTVVKEALSDKGIVSQANAEASLRAILRKLPEALKLELKEGSQGSTVILLQIYLIYTTDGPARDKLAAAGPTGFYGPATKAVVTEYQTANKIAETGVYDTATRNHMLKNDTFVLNTAK